MSLKEEFQDKMARFGLNIDWFEHPQLIIDKADAQIDAITNLAEAKAFLKKLIRFYGTVLWFLLQLEVEGR